MIPKISKSRALMSLAIVAALVLLLAWALNSVGILTLSTEEFNALVARLGIFGPLLIIGFLAVEVVIAPFPGFVAAIASGYSFGYVAGAIYVYIGTIAGSSIAFWLSRRFGRPVIGHFINQKKLDRFDCFFKDKGEILLWLIFLFPILPTDIASFTVGLSDFKFKRFFKIISVAYLPYIITTSIYGSIIEQSGLLSSKAIWFGSIVSAALIVGIILYFIAIKKDSSCPK